jgi:GTPase SAR1 family protein
MSNNIPTNVDFLIQATIEEAHQTGTPVTVLNLNEYQLQTLPTLLEELPDLEILLLDNNPLQDISGLVRLKNLKNLSLNNCGLTQLPEGLSELQQLESLRLANNRLTDLSAVEDLPNLIYLDISNNLINDLSPLKEFYYRIAEQLTEQKAGTYSGIEIANNPLSMPPRELADAGYSAIINYFKGLDRTQSYSNNVIKVILVGNSNAGKSTLLERLLTTHKPSKARPLTPWLSVKEKSIRHNDVTTHIRYFDFGGQDYYHNTHTLYFTSNAIYILLWHKQPDQESANNQYYDLHYWLDAIEQFANKTTASATSTPPSPNTTTPAPLPSYPILVVQNKVDQREDEVFLNQEYLRQCYPNIAHFFTMSAKNGNNVAFFKQHLQDFIAQQLTRTTTLLPAYYKNFEKFFEEQTCLLMDMETVKRFAESVLTPNDMNAKVHQDVITYFHNIGTILHNRTPSGYERIAPSLNHINEAIKKVLNKIDLSTAETTDHLITDTTLLDFLENNYLIFKKLEATPATPIAKGKAMPQTPPTTYLAPMYLPEQPNRGIALLLKHLPHPISKMEFTGFIHRTILFQIFSAVQSLINPATYYCWKHGLVIESLTTTNTGETTILLIKFDQKAINLYPLNHINTPADRIFINNITNAIKDVCFRYGKDSVQEMITANGIDFVPRILLEEQFAQKAITFHYKQQLFHIGDFHRYVQTPQKRIFISYSQQDSHHKDELLKHLSVLKRSGDIRAFDNSQIVASELWGERIKQELRQADIILLLISADALATDYIWDVEIQQAIERHKKNEAALVPIILSACDWKEAPFAHLSALPANDTTITSFPFPNDAWSEVVVALRKIIRPNN